MSGTRRPRVTPLPIAAEISAGVRSSQAFSGSDVIFARSGAGVVPGPFALRPEEQPARKPTSRIEAEAFLISFDP